AGRTTAAAALPGRVGRALDTAGAVVVLADRALRHAAVAAAGGATWAATRAVFAVVVLAVFAVIPVLGPAGTTAVVAFSPTPLHQRHVRAAGVVMVQDAADKAKGIGQAALLQ